MASIKTQNALPTSKSSLAKPRLTGEPIMRILCKKTDTLVGYLYQWNNGDLQPAWLDSVNHDVQYLPLIPAAHAKQDNKAQKTLSCRR